MSELAAKRWAKALIELTKEDASLSGDEILRTLRDVAETFNSSEELKSVVNNPSISVEEKQIVLSKMYQDKITPIVYNFLFALNLRKRLNIINEIADEYEKELEQLNNIVRVNVVSAIDINENKKEDINTRLKQKFNKEVKTNWNVDNDIIGGLLFNVNGTVVDNSIKHRLEKLSENIIKMA